LLRGVSSKRFSQFFKNPEKELWGTLLPGQQKAPVHIYMVNDESVKTAVAEFLGTKNLPLTGISFVTKEEIVRAVKLDPYAVGFCNLVDVLGVDTRSLAENIRLLPVDKNSNGTIDYMEDIYSDANTFLRGVWIGKYPKTLYTNIYAVSKVQPVNEAELSYLKWILNDGQQYLNKNGYCDLAGSESQSQLDKINTTVVSIPTTTAKSSVFGILLLILGIVISVGVITFKVIRAYRNQESIIPDFNIQSAGFDENTIAVPAGLYFDKTHTWAFMEKDGDVTIGLDDFLQHITGPINRIVMKNQGERIKKGDLLFTIIQNGKQLNLYSPVSGIIRKQNDLLTKDSSFLNTAPYSEGWVYQIEPGNWHKEIQFMDMAMQYRRWLSTEFSRVKDFLAATLKPDSLQYSHVVLQDGGVLKEGILNDFGPEVWDDFQTNFLDIYK
jgi:glycine cleavage system H lipoate-binding protein